MCYGKMNHALFVSVLGVTGLFLAAAPEARGQRGPCGSSGQPRPGTDDDGPALADYGLYLEPVAGITTARYPVPGRIAVPLGTVVTFFQGACAHDQVFWEGANSVLRDDSGERAASSMDTPGITSIRVQVVGESGEVVENTCEVETLDIALGAFQVRAINIKKEHGGLTEDSSNEETMQALFGQSIAGVRRVGPNRYSTSVDRRVTYVAKLRPSAMASLTEWRINDRPVALGEELSWHFAQVGTHKISTGPPGRAASIFVQTYNVRIVSHDVGDFIDEGTPVTFQAVTEPPGFEDDITWLAATQFGTGSPLLGYGPTFTVTFQDTYGPVSGDNLPFPIEERINQNPRYRSGAALWQYLGAKADNDIFDQIDVIVEAEEE